VSETANNNSNAKWIALVDFEFFGAEAETKLDVRGPNQQRHMSASGCAGGDQLDPTNLEKSIFTGRGK